MRHERICYAPTTDELLEELPDNVYKELPERFWFCIEKTLSSYSVSYQKIQEGNGNLSGESLAKFEDESLPEALASCWLWLKKEGLI